MTSLLAVETSTTACSVALQVANRTFARSSNKPRSHSKLLMAMVQDILKEADLQPHQLDALAVTVGPGSFTGLRIGFATVQGLAYAHDIPVVPLSTLKVMAATYLSQHPSDIKLTADTEIIAVLDARMSEFSLGRYGLSKDSEIVLIEGDQLLNAEQALSRIHTLKPTALVGEADLLVDTNPELAAIYTPLYPLAEAILPLAQAQVEKGNALPVTEVDLVYLRGAEAWQKRKRLREA